MEFKEKAKIFAGGAVVAGTVVLGAFYFGRPAEAHRDFETRNPRQEERRTFPRPTRGFKMEERCEQMMKFHHKGMDEEEMEEHMEEHMGNGMGMMGGMMGE